MSSSSSLIEEDLPKPWNEQPFSQNLRSDIVLLSSMLHGTQPGPGNFSQPRPKDNNTLNFLTHISNVLTIGNDRNVNAENVHALTGHLEKERAKCLVFVENSQPTKNYQREVTVAADQAGRLYQQVTGDLLLVAADGDREAKAKSERLQREAKEAIDRADAAAELGKGRRVIEPSFVKKDVNPDVDKGRLLLHSWTDGDPK